MFGIKKIATFFFDKNIELSVEHTIDITKDYKILDIKDAKDELGRLGALKDLSFLFEEFEEFNFDELIEHQSLSSDIKYLESNYLTIFEENKLKMTKDLRELNYKHYTDIRYSLMLLAATTGFFQKIGMLKIEDNNEQKGKNNKIDIEKQLMIELMPIALRRGSCLLSDHANDTLKENDKIVNSSNSKKEIFDFSYKIYIYMYIMGLRDEDLEGFRANLAKGVKEYYKTIKNSYKDSKNKNYQSNMINLLRLKKVGNLGDTKDYADDLKSSVIQSIKDDIDKNLPKDINEAKEYLEKYLFYKFHEDITNYIDELLKTINDILSKVKKIETALKLKELYRSKALSDELKVFYETNKQYENKAILKDVNDKLSSYETKISKATTYQEFLDAKALCVDDKDIKTKEDKFYSGILEDILLIDDPSIRYEKLGISSRFQSHQQELIGKFGLKSIDKFYIDGVECIRKDEVSLMMRNGDINIDFAGLSSKNRLLFTIDNGQLSITFKLLGKEQQHFIKQYIPNSKQFPVFNDFYKIDSGVKYKFDTKITMMVGFALMVDVEVINSKLYFNFYQNNDNDIKKLVIGKMKFDFWSDLKIKQDRFIYFKDDEALKEYNIIKKGGYYFKDDKPIFDRVVRVNYR